MQREPFLHAVAGTIFGFVLGYMAANLGGPAPVVDARAGLPATTDSAAAPGVPGRGKTPAALDPNEVRALESLAQRDKASAAARIQLGNLYMDHERHEEAVKWYAEALGIDPKNADVRVDMGACLVSLGRAQEALAAFDLALRDSPGHKKASFNKGIALMQSGRPKEAVAVWEELLKKYPDDPQLQGLRDQIAQVRASRAGS